MAESIATVMLVGASGVGKSTLGNYLLYGSPDYGFVAASSMEPVTLQCETLVDMSWACIPFAVIDTPGIPDPKGDTKAYFNAIVERTRHAGSLNAVVYVVEYAQNRINLLSNLENAAVILKEFKKLGCAVFIACRVPDHLPGRSKTGTRETVTSWTTFTKEISDVAGIEPVATFFLDTAGIVWHARDMRSKIIGCPAIPITSNSGMQTFDELTISVKNRVDEKSRRSQLNEDVKRLLRDNTALQHTADKLESSAAKCRRAGHCMGVAIQGIGMVMDVGTVGALVFIPSAVAILLGATAQGVGGALHDMKIKDALLKKATIRENEVAVDAMKAEEETGQEDSKAVLRDQEKLRKLTKLFGFKPANARDN